MDNEYYRRQELQQLIRTCVKESLDKFLNTTFRNEEAMIDDIASSLAWRIDELYNGESE